MWFKRQAKQVVFCAGLVSSRTLAVDHLRIHQTVFIDKPIDSSLCRHCSRFMKTMMAVAAMVAVTMHLYSMFFHIDILLEALFGFHTIFMMRIVGGGVVNPPCPVSMTSMPVNDCSLEITMCRRHLTDFTTCLLTIY